MACEWLFKIYSCDRPVLKDCSPDAQVIFLFMVYSDRQMRVADATIKQLLANESSMTRDSMLAYVDELFLQFTML